MRIIQKKNIIIAAVALVVCLAVYLILIKDKETSSSPTNPAQATSQESESKFDGPTEEEKREADQHKNDLVAQQQAESSQSTAPKTVTPIISSASQNGQEVFVSAFIPGIYENDGLCTFVFTKNNSKITKTSSSISNASTTDCTNITIPKAEFPESGSWSLVATYSSPKSGGDSSPKQLTIQ